MADRWATDSPAHDSGSEGVDRNSSCPSNDEVTNWKENAQILYNLIMTQTLKCPSLTTEWLPLSVVGDSSTAHHLLVGTGDESSGHEQHSRLQIASIELPMDSRYGNEEGELGAVGKASDKFKLKIQVPHKGAVLCARHMPTQYNVIATKNPSSDVFIYDISKQPSTSSPLGQPVLQLHGKQKTGCGLSWNRVVAGLLLSTSNEKQVCLWNINSTRTSNGLLNADRIFNSHPNIVEDVTWNPRSSSFFGCVCDKKLMTWDTRCTVSTKPTHAVAAHEAKVNCLSFNYDNPNLVVTGSADRTVAMWDLRNTKKRVHTFALHNDNVLHVNWSPINKTILASSSADGRINIWDSTKTNASQSAEHNQDGPPELLFVHAGHRTNILDFSWNPFKPWMICSLSDDNVMQVWQVAEDIYSEVSDAQA